MLFRVSVATVNKLKQLLQIVPLEQAPTGVHNLCLVLLGACLPLKSHAFGCTVA